MAQGSQQAGAASAEVIRLATRGEAPLRAPVDLAKASPFELNGLAVDPLTRQLAYPDGESETLEPRVMEVFVALHRAEGAVLSRDDLLAACWRSNVVGEDAIQRVIQRLRKVASRSGAFKIDTITKAGYRLLAESGEAAGVRGDAPSLAVLPFTSRSGVAEDEVFAFGMAEDLIEALAQGVNVRVLASSTTLRQASSSIEDLQAAGRRLGVRYFLEGQVRRIGDELRVTAQLIEAANSEIAWSQRFERHLDDFAQLQGDLVSEVAAALGATIYKLEMDRALRKPSNLTAWECVARAIAANREYGAEPLARAVDESLRAVEIAPDYGLAHAVVALTLSGAYFTVSLPDPAQEAKIQQHIDRAFALDPDHAGVLAMIAAASAYIGRPAEGLPRAERAVRLRPGHGFGHYAAGIASLLHGSERTGIGHLERFLAAEPDSHLHFVTNGMRGVGFARVRDFDAARRALTDSLALFPGNFSARLIHAVIDQYEGHGAHGEDHLTTARQLEPAAGADIYRARIDRFFAGSDLREEMHGALAALWT